MLPIVLLGGAAAAFLLSSCSQQKKPELLSPPPKPPPPPPLPKNFGNDKVVQDAYAGLKQAGVSDADMDQGCPMAHYNENGTTMIVEGKGDRNLDSCEVYEYALNRYGQYREIVENITGKPIPWSLDYNDPKINFDKKIRKKIENTISFLDQLLQKKGFKTNSQDYKIRLIKALFILVTFPNPNKNLDYKNKAEQFLNYFDAMLNESDLQEFKAVLRKEGGFKGKSEDDKELTALESINQGIGDCTESSKILFAVLKMAGFDPFFVFVNPWKTEMPAILPILMSKPGYFHVCIGIHLGGNLQLLDPSFYSINPPHHDYYSLSLRQYLSMDFINRGGDFNNVGKEIDAMQSYDFAIKLDNTSFLPYVNKALIWGKRKNHLDALREITEAHKINPYYDGTFSVRGEIKLNLHQFEEALADFDTAVQKNPLMPIPYYGRGFAFLFLGKSNEATENLTLFYMKMTSSLDKETSQLAQKNLTESFYWYFRYQLNQSIQKEPKEKERYEKIERETDLDLIGAQARFAIAAILWEANDKDKAKSTIKQIVDIVLQKKEEMAKEKQKFSVKSLIFLSSLYEELPTTMQYDSEVSAMRDQMIH